jgi:hypothetical protein
MASVIVRPVRVVPEPPREYVLTLSRDEAQALLDLTYCVNLLLKIELQRQGVIMSDVAVTLRGQAVVAQGSSNVQP